MSETRTPVEVRYFGVGQAVSSQDGRVGDVVAAFVVVIFPDGSYQQISNLELELFATAKREHRKEFGTEIDRLRAELATLRAKMAGMVCGTCKGAGGEKSGKDNGIEWTSWTYCPVCQPAKEGK